MRYWKLTEAYILSTTIQSSIWFCSINIPFLSTETAGLLQCSKPLGRSKPSGTGMKETFCSTLGDKIQTWVYLKHNSKTGRTDPNDEIIKNKKHNNFRDQLNHRSNTSVFSGRGNFLYTKGTKHVQNSISRCLFLVWPAVQNPKIPNNEMQQILHLSDYYFLID